MDIIKQIVYINPKHMRTFPQNWAYGVHAFNRLLVHPLMSYHLDLDKWTPHQALIELHITPRLASSKIIKFGLELPEKRKFWFGTTIRSTRMGFARVELVDGLEIKGPYPGPWFIQNRQKARSSTIRSRHFPSRPVIRSQDTVEEFVTPTRSRHHNSSTRDCPNNRRHLPDHKSTERKRMRSDRIR
jgi:hypothetical protein